MKLIFQAYGVDQGGGIANVHLLLQAYAAKFERDELVILCSNGSPLEKLGRLPNCRVLGFPNDSRKEARRFWLNTQMLHRLSRSQQADVVWGLNLGSYVRLEVPQILSLNNAHQVYPIESTRTHPGSPMRVALLRWFFRRSLAVSDGVITQTAIMAQLVRQDSHAPARIAVIPKAVENQRDVEAQSLPLNVQRCVRGSSEASPFCFLYVATCIPAKNHSVVIAAVEQLRLSGLDVRLILTISEDEARRIGGPAVSALIESGHLVPLGWVAKEHLGALYDLCDACVMPSVLESLSSAHLEAMAWGRAQITSDLPYARDLCGDAALYAHPYDARDWAEKMCLLVKDQATRQSLVALGLEQMKRFPATWTDVALMAREFLVEVLDAWQSKGG